MIDNRFRRRVLRFRPAVGALFDHFLAGASITRSPLSFSTRVALDPFGDAMAVAGDRFAVASAATNAAVATDAVFTSEAAAMDHIGQPSRRRLQPGGRDPCDPERGTQRGGVMSGTIGTYSFLPWLRRGHRQHDHRRRWRPRYRRAGERAGRLRIAATGPAARHCRARSTATSRCSARATSSAIDRRAIVRMEPRPGITNFEPNYLPFVEFYDEDFPWRYTPAAPDAPPAGCGRG